jgi:hypothetical protein
VANDDVAAALGFVVLTGFLLLFDLPQHLEEFGNVGAVCSFDADNRVFDTSIGQDGDRDFLFF